MEILFGSAMLAGFIFSVYRMEKKRSKREGWDG